MIWQNRKQPKHCPTRRRDAAIHVRCYFKLRDYRIRPAIINHSTMTSSAATGRCFRCRFVLTRIMATRSATPDSRTRAVLPLVVDLSHMESEICTIQFTLIALRPGLANLHFNAPGCSHLLTNKRLLWIFIFQKMVPKALKFSPFVVHCV